MKPEDTDKKVSYTNKPNKNNKLIDSEDEQGEYVDRELETLRFFKVCALPHQSRDNFV